MEQIKTDILPFSADVIRMNFGNPIMNGYGSCSFSECIEKFVCLLLLIIRCSQNASVTRFECRFADRSIVSQDCLLTGLYLTKMSQKPHISYLMLFDKKNKETFLELKTSASQINSTYLLK